jgi:hypothetical protein
MANVRLSTIRGTGVAASCCAHLLEAAGFQVGLAESQRPRIPAILVSEAAQVLLRDVFGRPDLFDGLFRIDRRIVAWEPGSATVTLPHRAAVISEEALLKLLRPGRVDSAAADVAGRTPYAASPLPEPSDVAGWTAYAASPLLEPSDVAGWTVYTASPPPGPVERHGFGSRTASIVPANLKDAGPPACWIEALEWGWLFLIPTSPASGWLISIGGPHEVLLAESRLIADRIEVSGPSRAPFPTYPAIADPLCGPGWLACGAAALAFDPLCGDGTGNAVREAILASAVIRAASAKDDVDRLLSHYRARLILGLVRHLELCRGFYVSGNRGPWWEREIVALEEGMAWCRQALGAGSASHYRLRGFELQAIG